MSIIGLGGLKRSGKDTIADFLVSEHGYVKENMSDPINEATRIADPEIIWRRFRIPLLGEVSRTIRYSQYLDDVCGGDFTRAKEHKPFRDALIATGDVGRYLSATAWTEKLGEIAERGLGEGRNIVLSGLRFPTEIDLVKKLGGRTVWVTRPGHEDTSDTGSTENSVSADDFDEIIVNDGSLNDLFERARRLAERATRR